jgi:hypothetical protein
MNELAMVNELAMANELVTMGELLYRARHLLQLPSHAIGEASQCSATENCRAMRTAACSCLLDLAP